ncbi:double zinc ribbon domain-containing protein [Azoarcus olearius]|uniref:Hypothetical membrane protein n=1 Tax=Azoarcus sp. (strain BH72) TaxID=418699 RepID=A1K201_AZOSB|nr:zinc-ribbon domain-containing protein [Azoarcus olearius]CAL92856.1 hypothetical membrane protein [Azoarcus olearius]
MDCPACGHPNRTSAHFCSACGQHLDGPVPPALQVCPSCGRSCRGDAHFCPACGFHLAGPLPDMSDIDFSQLDPARAEPGPAAQPFPPMGEPDATVILPPGWTATRPPAPDPAPAPASEARPGADAPAAAGGDEPAAGPTPVPPPPPADSAGRRPLALALGFVLVVVAGLAAWWTTTAPHDEPPPPPPVAVDDAAARAERALALAERALAERAQLDTAPAAGSAATPDTAAPPPVAEVDTAAANASTQPVAAVAPAAAPRPVRTLYARGCAACHERGANGAPRTADPEQWQDLLQGSPHDQSQRVLAGHGGAPAGAGLGLTPVESERLVAHVGELVGQARTREAAAERSRAAERSARATTAAAERPAAPAAPRQDDWQRSLKSELARCGQLGFFERVACTEKARWTYCNNRWNSVPECAVRNHQSAP